MQRQSKPKEECKICGSTNIDTFPFSEKENEQYQTGCLDCDTSAKPKKTKNAAVNAWNRGELAAT